MKTTFVLLLGLVLVGGAYYWYATPEAPGMDTVNPFGAMDANEMASPDAMPENPTSGAPAAPAPAANTTGAGASVNVNADASVSTGTVKEFTVTGKNFSFLPATMSVKKGDRVRITFVNESGTHDLVVDGYNARTNIIQGGAKETIEFVADKAGTFEYYCSVGKHREMGMKGTLTVQ